jgi:predicted RNA binding protein YcfA (HicA-like mRNA interferase family)
MLKSSRDIKRRLEQDGWVIERIRAPTISFAPLSGAIIVLPHPRKDLGAGLVRKIYKQAGWQPD